jgi:lysophospholipase L1-like esterase
MRITNSLMLALVLTLAACGGGSSGASPSSNTPPPQNTSGDGNTNTPPPPPPSTGGGDTTTPKSTGGLVEYYGDSTVWGWKTNSPDPNNGTRIAVPAPLAFQNALPATPTYAVVNEGASGSTACDLLNGTDGTHNVPWSEQLDKRTDGKWVIVNHGINDLIKTGSLSTYRNCLSQLVRIAKQKGREVVLETPNPISPAGLDQYAQAMRDVAAQEGAKLIDQYQMLTQYMTERNLQVADIVPDGLHPTEEIYQVKGQYAARVFSQELYP